MNITEKVDKWELKGDHQRYHAYKDLSVDWLGRIPKNWSHSKLKWLLRRNESGVWGDSPDTSDEPTTVLRSTDQTVDGEWAITDPAKRNLGDEEAKEYALEAGDLLVTTSSGSEKHLGKTTYVNQSLAQRGAAFSNFMQRLRTKESLGARYLYWILNCPVGRSQFNYYGSSTTGLANLNSTVLGRLDVPVPSLAEQHAIATFLDRETKRIDALIGKKERLIDLMEEKRTALISRVVTEGLDESVETQDTGVEWLGKIPAHWEMVKLNHVTNEITNGYVGATSDILRDDGVRYLQSTHIKDGDIIFDHDPYYVEKEWSEARAKSVLERGWVLIVQTGDVGQCAAVTEEFVGANCHALIIAKPRGHLNGFWLSYFLRSRVGQALMLSTQTGATLKHLGCTEIKDMNVLLPPLDEQQKIVEHLDEQEARIDALAEKVEVAIERLKEYRTALISAAVTGQIDVREEVSTAPVG